MEVYLGNKNFDLIVYQLYRWVLDNPGARTQLDVDNHLLVRQVISFFYLYKLISLRSMYISNLLYSRLYIRNHFWEISNGILKF